MNRNHLSHLACTFLSLILIAPSLFGQMKTQSLPDESLIPQALDLKSVKNKTSLSPLSEFKWYQVNRQWETCVQKGGGLLGDQSLGPWPLVVYLECLKSWYSLKKGTKVKTVLSSFRNVEKHKMRVLGSPFEGHRDLILRVFLDLIELSLEKSRNDWGTFIDRNSDLVDWMSSEQRGRYYKNLGEMAWLRQKNGLAKVNFLRSYAFQKDSKVLRRLERLKATGSLKIDKYSKEFIEAADERKLWNKFSSSVKNGQTNRIAKYGAEFLNAFPGSQRVDSVRDQVNRVYKRLLYRRGERFQLSKQNFENELMKAPPQYLLFWATEAYERGYQKSSFRLAKRAADRWEGTDEAAQALLLAGRSAYYLVDRSSAKSFFTELTEKYSGSLASQEARYYLGLLYYREGDLNKMVKLYDEFLLSRGSDKWELQVRYWLWRALKKNGSRRSEEIGETILKEFPLTYYGLMVRMEDKGNLQSIFKSKDPAISSEAWWPKSLASRVGRIQKLLKSGWVKEAETEIFYLPDPESAAGFVSRAKVWKKAGVFNRSIKDFAEAIDRDHSFLTSGVLKESFPVDHQMDVEKAAKEFSMSPYLIWSIIRQESAFMKEAISPSRAYGLMQLLSPTARETARWLKVKSFRMTRDIFKPEINIRFGSHFLSRMIGKYKSVIPLAVASYNVGPGNLDRWLSHRTDLKNWAEFGASPDDEMWVDELPWAETSFYVKAVMRNYLLYQIIHNQLDRLESPAWKTAKIQTGK